MNIRKNAPKCGNTIHNNVDILFFMGFVIIMNVVQQSKINIGFSSRMIVNVNNNNNKKHNKNVK